MISAWLLGSCGGAGVSGAGAGVVIDFRGATEFAGDHDQDSFVEASFVDVFDQG